MEDQQTSYEERKRAIQFKKARQSTIVDNGDDFDPDLYEKPEKEVRISDVAQVGSKILIGGGLGLLAGVGTIAVAASAAEVVVAGVVTKIAGIIGGAVGLSMGVNKFLKKKRSY